jgi:hypothetical protein
MAPKPNLYRQDFIGIIGLHYPTSDCCHGESPHIARLLTHEFYQRYSGFTTLHLGARESKVRESTCKALWNPI